MKNKYYSLAVQDREASVYIYGDIASWEWLESDVSSYTLSKEIEGLNVDVINVRINSYGGEVKEGMGIYNALKDHKAKIVTVCDGFGCSAASVIFMAGDERKMQEASLLMIHNALWTASGNSEDFKKAAAALEKMSQQAASVYKAAVNIDDEKLQEMLDTETWITPQEAVEMGFATEIIPISKSGNPSQCVRKAVFEKMCMRFPAVEVRIADLPELHAKLQEIQASIDSLETRGQQSTGNKLNFMAALTAESEE